MAADKSLGFNITALDNASKSFIKLGEHVDRLTRKIDELDRAKADLTITVDTKKAEAEVGSFARSLQQRIERAVRNLPEIKLDADASAAQRRIQEIRARLAELADKRIGVGIDAVAARTEIDRLSAELTRLSRRSPNIQVTADTARAAAALTGVAALANRVGRQNVAISVNASDVSRAISLLGLLTAALAAASAVAAPAAAALAAVPALGGAAVQGIAGVATGLSGIGDAVKALSDQESKAATVARQSGQERAAAADRIASAQSSLRRATEQADRAAIQGAQRVEDAQRAVTDAYEDGARRVASAERALTAAQRQQRDAQEDLTRARQDAQEQLEDLQRDLRGAALSEREAAIRLAEAQEELDQARAAGLGGRDLEKLELAYERAALGAEEAADRSEDLARESAEAARVGVSGSAQVVAAQRRAEDATQDVRDAEADLAQAREDAAERVTDAQEQLARAQQQAAWAQADAAAQIVDAQRQVAAAMRDTGTAGQASMDKVQQAMEDLSPEGHAFATFLATELIPALKAVRTSVQGSLLPRFETSLRNLMVLAPEVTAGLTETGRVMGDLAVRGSEMMTTGPWRRDFATIMAGNNRVLEDFGGAGLAGADAMRHLTITALPMIERLSQATERGARLAAQWLATKRASGELDAWFERMGDTLAELGRICMDIIRGFIQVSEALRPLGMVLLDTLGKVVSLIGAFAEAHPQLAQFGAAAIVAVAAFNKIGAAIAGLTLAAGVATGGWKQLATAITGFAPSNLVTRLARVQDGLDKMAVSAGFVTAKWTESAAAGQKVAVAGSRVGAAAVRAASALPALGVVVAGLALAYDGLVTSADEAAEALLQGGAAADAVRQKLSWQDKAAANARQEWKTNIPVLQELAWVINNVGKAVAGTIPTTEDAARKAQELRDQMTPLQLAQSNVTEAMNEWGQATKEANGNYSTVSAAALKLSGATEELKRQQEAAEMATRSYTDALREQSSQMLSSIDTEIRYQEAADRLTDSIAENGRTVDLHTAAGRSNVSALQDMARAANDHLQAMTDQGAAVAEVSAKEREYRDRLYQSALQIGMTKDAARAYVDQVLLTPVSRTTTFYADTGPAARAINDFINSQAGRELVLQVRADTAGNILTNAVPGRAAGGPIFGPGTGTSDSVVARLSNGEHVWTAREVAGAGGHGQVARLRSAASAGALPRFAGGGPVAAYAAGGAVRGSGSGDLLGSLDALAAEIGRTAVPALDDLAERAGEDTPDAIRSLASATDAGAAGMARTWSRLGRDTQAATDVMRRSMTTWQSASAAGWADVAARSRAAITAITGPQFGGLRSGMDQVRAASTRMSDWVGQAYSRMRGLTADPIRWTLTNPINRGLVPAWNSIDRFFALNRPMGPVPVGFNTGGQVPGSGDGDIVPALLTPGEFVVRKQIAEPMRHFLAALNDGQAEAVQAAGGRFARFALGGTVERAQAFARAQHGKPYIWGGVGPAGYDCSGFQSAITNVALGEPPHRRRFTTASFARGPAGGFVPGLTSAYGIGVFQGSPGHMAGTLGGLNVESGGSPSMTKAGPGAAGATSGQFTARYSLPQVGGRFISGGAAGFDMAGYLGREFAATRAMIGEIVTRFGRGNYPAATSRFGGDAVAGASRSVTGFDTGGLWRGGMGVNLSGRPERVLSPAQTAAFDQLVAALSTRRGSAPIIVTGTPAATAPGGQAGIPPQMWAQVIEQAAGRAVASALAGAGLRIVDDGRQGLARIVTRQQRTLARQG